MVKFDYGRMGLTIREMAFGTMGDVQQKGCDVVYMHSNDTDRVNVEKHISGRMIRQEQYTLVNDLSQEENVLYDKITKNYRYEIRRAQKEGTVCETIDKKSKDLDNILAEFKDIYETMFSSKGMRNKFNESLVRNGIKAENILITKATNPNNSKCVVYHAYLVDGENAMLMYSASTLATSVEKEEVNLIGWMNKFLHWYDMKQFKDAGLKKYEWGGIGNKENPSGIAKFKMCFGGETVKYYNYLYAASLLGGVYVYFIKRRSAKWQS